MELSVTRPRQIARTTRLGMLLGLANQPRWLVEAYGGTDKVAHGYMQYYRRHLGPRRFTSQTVFEIGVGGYESTASGGSLAVWRDFLVRSRIVGLDIHEKRIDLGRRVSFMRTDQSDSQALTAVVEHHGRPSVIIDDGSHIGEHIWTTFDTLWPHLLPGGLYVVEDISTSYYPSFGGGNPPPRTSAVTLMQTLGENTQAHDPTFSQMPEWGSRDVGGYPNVQAVHIYPGIFFIEKR
jgi:hypothetical protein